MACYIDLDGVLVRLHLEALRHYGVKLDEFPGQRRTMDIVNAETGSKYEDHYLFWSTFDESFWAFLPPFEWAHKLVIFAGNTFGHGDVYVATRPTHNPKSRSGKQLWCDRYLPGWLSSNVIMIKDKFRLATGKHDLLIDDSPENCRQFAQRGQSILIGRPWNGRPTQTFEKLKEEIHDACDKMVDLD